MWRYAIVLFDGRSNFDDVWIGEGDFKAPGDAKVAAVKQLQDYLEDIEYSDADRRQFEVDWELQDGDMWLGNLDYMTGQARIKIKRQRKIIQKDA